MAYTPYNVEVKKRGFYTVENIGVPIFEGITSIQTAEMIPHNDTQFFSPLRPQTTFFENLGYPLLSGEDAEIPNDGERNGEI